MPPAPVPRPLLPLRLTTACLVVAGTLQAAPPPRTTSPQPMTEAGWRVLSSRTGDLEAPVTGTEQTSAVVGDFDGDGLQDFAITERTASPSVVWYRRTPTGWRRSVIEARPTAIEAGACTADVDGDGDLDLVAGGDHRSAEVWWWENPGPRPDRTRPWVRRAIKRAGAPKHHDLAFGDVDGDGAGELVFWNQGARTLFLATVPADPRAGRPWLLRALYTYDDDGQPEQRSRRPEPSWKGVNEHEGLALADIDGDGVLDVVAGGWWFAVAARGRVPAHPIDPGYTFTRTAVGQLVEGGRPEVVLVAGDGAGPLMYYEWVKGTWLARTLLETVQDGHSLAIADVDGDRHLDIFVAEMRIGGGNPEARMYLLRGDSRGNFRPGLIGTGYDHHESKVADLDGDGRLDILGKPYNHGTPDVAIWVNKPPG